MREKYVAVAVVYDPPRGFLVVENARWNGLAFPMRDLDPATEVYQTQAHVALEQDLGGRLPRAQVHELGYLGRFDVSGGTGEDTGYHYWAFHVVPGQPLALPPGAAYLPYADLLAHPRVTGSTKAIAQALIGSQDAVVVVVTRPGPRGTEYLLVWSDAYGGYFFPTTRVRAEFPPAVFATQVLHNDLGYRGDFTITWAGEVPNVQFSRRFGMDRAYRFQLGRVTLARPEEAQPGGPLDSALAARVKKYVWVTGDDLGGAGALPLSPTVLPLRAAVTNLVP